MFIYLNGQAINIDDYDIGKHGQKTWLSFDFKVTHEDYHDVTVLLYDNDFRVEFPDESLDFQATIYRYYTSFTNLYVEGNVGDFHVELIEV
ncbi:hypothetical protein ABID56_001384 [Alkalibacillus flavidus]|uniref:DUF3219 family protein n=1 Tax=Alkalibacillus flavidus TaxID=546021 RepID=A0ABV2KVC0_9BACI